MKIIISILRDPIWQSFGVIAAILLFFVANGGSGFGSKELVSIHLRQSKVVDQWISGDGFKIQIDGKFYDASLAVADYFYLYNKSSSSIAPDDFFSRIEASSRQGASIKQVSSCSTSYAEACTADPTKTSSGGAWIHTSWTNSDGKWSSEGPLINPDDAACILIISEPVEGYEKGRPLAELSARVKGFNFKFYESMFAFSEDNKRWYHKFATSIYFSGVSIYWMMFLFCILVFFGLRLLDLAGFGGRSSASRLFAQTGVAFVSICTAEILTDVYFNRGGDFFSSEVHWIAWPLLLAHSLVVLLLVVKAKRVKASVSSSGW